jgi:hypothetical protein
MKNVHSTFATGLVLIILLFNSCSKDDMTNKPVNGAFGGSFVSSAHNTSGTASIDEDQTTLTLTNFKTDAGPDLNMYLSSNLSNITADYIDLGDIKGVEGNFTYDLPDNVDFTTYKYVVVWCVAFNVNFGYAELAEQ